MMALNFLPWRDELIKHARFHWAKKMIGIFLMVSLLNGILVEWLMWQKDLKAHRNEELKRKISFFESHEKKYQFITKFYKRFTDSLGLVQENEIKKKQIGVFIDCLQAIKNNQGRVSRGGYNDQYSELEGVVSDRQELRQLVAWLQQMSLINHVKWGTNFLGEKQLHFILRWQWKAVHHGVE